MSTEIQQKPKSEAQKSLEMVKSREVDLSELAGASDSPGMQIAVAFGQAMRTNPQIALCTAESKMAAIYKVAALNMDCSGTTGEVWLVPINETQPDKTKVLKLNVWVGVAGMLKLARRSGMVASVNCAAVREGDVFRYVPTDATTPLYHEPRSGTAKVIAFWAQVVLTSGAKETAVVWEDEFDALVAAGQAKSFSPSAPWNKHPAKMVELVAIRRALKRAPRSIQQLPMQVLVTDDGEVIRQRPQLGRDAAEVVAETNLLTSEPDAEVSSDDQ